MPHRQLWDEIANTAGWRLFDALKKNGFSPSSLFSSGGDKLFEDMLVENRDDVEDVINRHQGVSLDVRAFLQGFLREIGPMEENRAMSLMALKFQGYLLRYERKKETKTEEKNGKKTTVIEKGDREKAYDEFADWLNHVGTDEETFNLALDLLENDPAKQLGKHIMKTLKERYGDESVSVIAGKGGKIAAGLLFGASGLIFLTLGIITFLLEGGSGVLWLVLGLGIGLPLILLGSAGLWLSHRKGSSSDEITNEITATEEAYEL